MQERVGLAKPIDQSHNELTPFGDYLRQERIARQVSLEELSWSTKIRMEYLTSLEAGDFSNMPAEVFVKGYIKAYAFYLELDPEDVLQRYARCIQGEDCSCGEVVRLPVERHSFFSRVLGWLYNLKKLLTGREDFQVY